MRGVVRVYPQCVVIYVAMFKRDLFPAFAPVFRELREGIDRIDQLRVLWINIQFVVILGAAGHMVRAFVPAFTKVSASVHAFTLVICLDNGINHMRVRRCAGQADTAKITAGQATLQLAPAFAAVGSFVNTTTRSAIDQRPYMAAALVT